MRQDFDDFSRRHSQSKLERARLQNETKAEYEILKGFVSQFAIDGKGLGSEKFQWGRTLVGDLMLVLGNVAAVLLTTEHIAGYGLNLRVLFTRKPVASMQMYIDDPPISNETWSVEPEIFEGNFVWSVSEHGDSVRYGAARLADQIAQRLGQYLIEYEHAYGREV